jgi:hypothetical protein
MEAIRLASIPQTGGWFPSRFPLSVVVDAVEPHAGKLQRVGTFQPGAPVTSARRQTMVVVTDGLDRVMPDQSIAETQ